MKKEFTVKNFKVFDEEGATFELAPITILTGCNSSGKSSMTKALLLLSKFVQKLKAEYRRTGKCHPKDLTLGLPNQEMRLGSFSSVLNCNASVNKAITLSYSQYNYTVEYTFIGEEPETTGEGWLSEIRIKTNQGTEVLHIKFKQHGQTFVVDNINIVVLKNDFFYLCARQKVDKINEFFLTDCDHHLYRIDNKQEYERILNELSQIGQHFEDIKQIHIDCIDGPYTPEVIKMLKLSEFEFYLKDNMDSANNYQGFGHRDFNTSSLFNVFDEVLDNKYSNPISRDLSEMLFDEGKDPFITYETGCGYFKKYLNEWLCEVIMPNELEEEHFHYVSSDRADIRRIYSDSNEAILGKTLKRYLHTKQTLITMIEDNRRTDKKHRNRYLYEISFLNYWIEKFGIGKGIDIYSTEEGAGMYVKLLKSTAPFEKGRLLADEGYGITQLVTVLVEIETTIFANRLSEKIEPKTIIIEEPEIHLHPKYQSLLAEMFLDAYRRANIHFIIETHSEYLIRRFMTLVLLKKQGQIGVDRENISMYYLFSPTEQPTGEPQVKKIGIREDGRLEDSFGSGFFDESEKLILDLMQIKTYK